MKTNQLICYFHLHLIGLETGCHCDIAVNCKLQIYTKYHRPTRNKESFEAWVYDVKLKTILQKLVTLSGNQFCNIFFQVFPKITQNPNQVSKNPASNFLHLCSIATCNFSIYIVARTVKWFLMWQIQMVCYILQLLLPCCL